MQIQAKGFWEKQSIDNTFALNDTLQSAVVSIAHVTMSVPRFEGFALASSGNVSRGVSIQGIDPALENQMSGLSRHVKKGEFLSGNSNGLLLGSKLAEALSIHMNDSLIVLGQGYHGMSAIGSFPVAGIVELPIPELDSRTVFMPLSQAQALFAAPGRLTALAIMIDDPQNMQSAKRDIARSLPAELVVKDWQEMMPELVQSIELDNSGGLIMLGILYMVIAFGVFGTAMMMAAERRHEFSILISVGMKRWKMNVVVFLETIIMGLTGALTGAAASIPLLLYFHSHPIRLSGGAAQAMVQYGFEPIMAFRVAPDMFFIQALVVLVISLLSSIYPVWSVGRFKIVNALRA
jgi:ABC-type lipoprotein release transport system permease subunit